MSRSARSMVLAARSWLAGLHAGRLGSAVVAAASGTGACALASVSDDRPVRVIAQLGAAVVVTAAVSGWRWLGSLATLAATAVVLLAAATSDEFRAGHLLVGSALLLLLVCSLDGVERPWRADPMSVRTTLQRRPLPQRVGVPLLAVLAAAAVAVTAAQPVVPSVGLVLLGLGAGLAAVLLATRSI